MFDMVLNTLTEASKGDNKNNIRKKKSTLRQSVSGI